MDADVTGIRIPFGWNPGDPARVVKSVVYLGAHPVFFGAGSLVCSSGNLDYSEVHSKDCRNRMKYIIRINPKAVDPITKEINEKRVWEVEQARTTDSEPVKWHCADVRIDETPIAQIFKFSKAGESPAEMEFYGICTRAQDDVIAILTKGRHEVQ